MKNVALIIIGIVIGSLASGFAVKHYYEEIMMWGLYMDHASDINKQVSVLTELRDGKKAKAITWLENYLVSDEAVLRGCKNDLCRDNSYPKFSEAIKKSETYRQKYNIK
ncbi:MAG: hypothetical protein ACWGOV_05970 [Acidiferrobacterales bacterium]